MIQSSKTKEYIEKANKVHKNKYDYSLVDYVNNRTKIKIICNEHGEFSQRPDNHLSGKECFHCGRISLANILRSSNEEFIEKANKVHKNKYNYSHVVYVNSFTKIKIICNEHGEFLQTPSSHQQGNGCFKCASNKLKTSIGEFKMKADKVHKNRYDYSHVDYVNSYTKIKIICNEHGEFLQTPHDHLGGSSCPRCYFDKRRLSNEEFKRRANKVHKNIYDYSLVDYVDNRTNVIIMCNEHGEFLQNPSDHTKGRGCPKCKCKSEQNVREIFEKIFEKEFMKIRISSEHDTYYELDGYNEELKLAFEYQGEQHYTELYYDKNKDDLLRRQLRDQIKLMLCKRMGIKLIVIPYHVDKEDFISKELQKLGIKQ
jgi:hypothetical protein